MTEESHPASDRHIFCCSGASNVGVLSFRAAIKLAQEGFGSFSCIAGIGSSNQPMIRAAKCAGERVSSMAARLVAGKDLGRKQCPG